MVGLFGAIFQAHRVNECREIMTFETFYCSGFNNSVQNLKLLKRIKSSTSSAHQLLCTINGQYTQIIHHSSTNSKIALKLHIFTSFFWFCFVKIINYQVEVYPAAVLENKFFDFYFIIAYSLVLIRFPLSNGDLAFYSQDKANIASLGFLVGNCGVRDRVLRKGLI